MKRKNFVAFLIIAVVFLAGFFLISHSAKNLLPQDIKYVQIAGQEIKVELALTEAEQNKGLSGRSELRDGEGMLFVFAKPGKYSFWMKDMNFPIDMVWFTPSEGGAGEVLKVVYIKKNADPKLYPETYGPETDAKYVLEVVAGFSDKNNLKVGDSVVFK